MNLDDAAHGYDMFEAGRSRPPRQTVTWHAASTPSSMSVIESSRPARTVARWTPLTNRRLLLMVRDQDAAARYEHLFKLFGATMIPVFSAAALLARLQLQPDALACDLDILDGDLHLIRRIRSRLEGSVTPALAMTSAPVASVHTQALLAGFQAYVAAEPLDLLLAVAQVLGDRVEQN